MIEQSLIDLVQLLAELPETALVAFGLYGAYWLIIKLSTVGAILYGLKLVLAKLPNLGKKEVKVLKEVKKDV